MRQGVRLYDRGSQVRKQHHRFFVNAIHTDASGRHGFHLHLFNEVDISNLKCIKKRMISHLDCDFKNRAAEASTGPYVIFDYTHSMRANVDMWGARTGRMFRLCLTDVIGKLSTLTYP